MALDPNGVRRLVFIKSLYKHAIAQSEMRGALAAASVLTFHDAVEMFLRFASEFLGCSGRDSSFMEYWAILAPKLRTELTQRLSMERLNKARVGLKHHGIIPSDLDVESFRATATSFFEENTPLVFDVSFEDLSLASLVQPQEARREIEQAETLLGEGNLEPALNKTALAFDRMLTAYEERTRDRFRRSPFTVGSDVKSAGRRLTDIRELVGSDFKREIEEFVDKLAESIEGLQRTVKVLALGLNYRSYSKFARFRPAIFWTADGNYQMVRKSSLPSTTSRDDVRFCIDFVIETAIVLQEIDISVPQES